MENTRFDQLSKLMGRATSRRGALRTMAAGTVGGAALVAASPAHAQDALGEEWVQLYEELAAAVDTVTGPCSNVTDAMRAFQERNADRLRRMHDDIATWTGEQVGAHQTAYGLRVQQAAIAINLAMTRCGYLEGSDSPYSLADIDADFTPATPEATPDAMAFGPSKSIGGSAWVLGQFSNCATPVCTSDCDPPPNNCDCRCSSDFTAGNCTEWALICADGQCFSDMSCCWSGICVAGFDHDQCVAQCGYCLNVGAGGRNCNPPSQ